MQASRFVVLAAVLSTGVFAASRSGAEPDGSLAELSLQANGVAEWLDGGVTTAQFQTGTPLFDAEWVFGTSQMAALGYGQQAQRDPERRDEAIARMELAIEGLLSAEGRAFDRAKWREDPIESLADGRGHAAWLGYTNLALSLHRSLAPDSKYSKLNDQLTDAIAERVAAAPAGVFETYPSERYPVDTAAGIASVMLHDSLTGADHSIAIKHWKAGFADRQRDPATGLLYQSTDRHGKPTDYARGSGTFLTAWFLSFADADLACELYVAGKTSLRDDVGPLAGMREYSPDVNGGMDIDSGPIVAGLGASSTGFAIGAAHACGDQQTAAALTQTANWIGRAVDTDGARHWKTGVQLGGAPVADAIMFAMMGTPERQVPSTGE